MIIRKIITGLIMFLICLNTLPQKITDVNNVLLCTYKNDIYYNPNNNIIAYIKNNAVYNSNNNIIAYLRGYTILNNYHQIILYINPDGKVTTNDFFLLGYATNNKLFDYNGNTKLCYDDKVDYYNVILYYFIIQKL